MNPPVLVTIVVAIALTAAACSSSSEDPAAVLAAYEDARNARDVDALIALYADDAVVIGHPLDADEFAEGVDEIRALEGQVPGIVGANGSTEYGSIEVSGPTVTFNQKFLNDEGNCFSSSGNKVSVEDGEIIRYEWGESETDLCS